VPDGHRLANRDAVHIEDVLDERMVAPVATSPMRGLFDALFERHGGAPRVVAEAATNEMILELVRTGLGATVTFASSAALVVGRGAVALEIHEQPPTPFLLVTRTRQEPTPAVKAFRDLAWERAAG